MTHEEAHYYGREEYVSNLLESLEDCYKTIREEIGKDAAEKAYKEIVKKQIVYYTEMMVRGYIYENIYRKILNLIKKASHLHDNYNVIKACDSQLNEAVTNVEVGVKSYRSGDLLIPGNIEELPALETARVGFVAPKTIDLRDYCIKTRNQFDRPWCAAYAATSFLSNVFFPFNIR